MDHRQSHVGDAPVRLVAFRVDDHRYALPLSAVERVIRAVEVTPLPTAPSIVLGVIDVHGRLVPVLNVRRRFLLAERDVDPADWFLLATTARRRVALVVDESEGVVERDGAEVVAAREIVANSELFPGVIRLDDGLALVHDLDRFLSLDDARMLDAAGD